MKNTSSHQNTFEYFWGDAIADKGFAAIPNCFFFCKANLSLDDQDLVVLGCLISSQFGSRKPYISAATIVKRLGKSASARRSSIRKLEKEGYIKRIYRDHESNEYDLQPGIQRLLNHDCINPVGKRAYAYRKIARARYQKTDTKEAKPRSHSNKHTTQSIGSITGLRDA